MNMPVLTTIRALLKFKDHTTISEIASTAGLSRKVVLETINRNGQFVWRNRKNGHITKVDPQASLREQLWKSGKFYRQDTFGAWSVEGHCLTFEGNADMREQLQQARRVGGLGDNYGIKVILDTQENRAALEAAGLRPWSEAIIDDRLWQEPAACPSTPMEKPEMTEEVTETEPEFEWAIVEIMGHRKHAGRVREEERFGAKMLRVDVPTLLVMHPEKEGDQPTFCIEKWTTHWYGGPSIFSFTLTDEESVMRINRPYYVPQRYIAPPDPDFDEIDDEEMPV